MLLWFGAFQVVRGVVYGRPLSVEPMMALAGVVVAGTVSYAALAAAGLFASAVLLIAGRAGGLSALSLSSSSNGSGRPGRPECACRRRGLDVDGRNRASGATQPVANTGATDNRLVPRSPTVPR